MFANRTINKLCVIALCFSVFLTWSCNNGTIPDNIVGDETSTENNTSEGSTDSCGENQNTVVEITSISLNKSAIGLLNNTTYLLTAEISPADCTQTAISWSSDDETVATVNSGQITADAANTGTATITARSTDNSSIFAECTVTVTDSPITVTGVSLNESNLQITAGNTASLSETIEPATATNQLVTWSSNNTDVATVSNGTVTAVSPGNAKITVTTTDGSFTAACAINVPAPSYTFSYYRNETDTEPYIVNYAQGDTATVINNMVGFSKAGYSFIGWNTNADGSGTDYVANDEIVMTGNLSLYAKWATNTSQSITFISPADEIIDLSEDQNNWLSLNGSDSLSVGVSGSFTQFAWYVDGTENSETSSTLNLAPTNLETLGIGIHKITAIALSGGIPYSKELRFRINYAAVQTWLVSFDAQGGSSRPAVYCANGQLLVEPSAPSRNGYTFSGWTTNSEGTHSWNFASDTVSSAMTLYAQWTERTYSLSYDANGGINAPTVDSSTYNSTITVATPGSMSRTEAIFIGWNTETDGSGIYYAEGDTFTIPADDSTLYALWDVNQYTVTFNGNGNTSGPGSASFDFDYGVTTGVPSASDLNMSKTNYTMTGWNTLPDYSGTRYGLSDNIIINSSVTLFAEWNETTGVTFTFSGPTDESINFANLPASDISISADDSLMIVIEQEFNSYQWYCDGIAIPGETTLMIFLLSGSLESTGIGVHTFTAVVETAEGIPYSKELTIRIVY